MELLYELAEKAMGPTSFFSLKVQTLDAVKNMETESGIFSSLGIQDSSCTPPKEEHTLKVTLATTAEGWDTTANGQLVIELAKNPRVKVYGLVPYCTQEQKEKAEKLNIELVNAKKRIGYSERELIACPPESLDIDILIIHSYGHDLGKQAQEIKDKKDCKWVHVVHTISEELETYVEKVSNPGTSDPRRLSDHDLQLALCEEADIVIAIGPKVADAYKTALLHCEKHKDVVTLTPGIIYDLLDTRRVHDGGEKFRVMISATYPSKYFKVKGCHIAAEAITLLQDVSYQLIFVVLPEDKDEDLKRQLEGIISSSQFTVKHVSRSTEHWRRLLCQVDLTIMPSAEGFGTSCVRAISADVPVLSSGNSGFGMAVKKLPSGGMHVLDSEDPQVWANRIREIRDKGPTQLAHEAKKLREEYIGEYCFKDQCDKLVEKMIEMFSSKKESKKICVEHTEKIAHEVVYAEPKTQQREVKNFREQVHDIGDVTKGIQELDLAIKNPDRMGREKEESIGSEVDKMRIPEQEEGFFVTKTSVEETGVTDQKSEFMGQENVAHDTVDACVVQETSSRLSVNVRDIPFSLRGKICRKLNVLRPVDFNDFRMLGELMKIDKDRIDNFAQEKNPTHELLTWWCNKTRQATVGKLIEILKHEDMKRMDIVEILEDWIGVRDSK